MNNHPPEIREFLPRAIAPMLTTALSTYPVVVLTGARQTGKSTLATLAGEDRSFFSLDERALFDQARDDPDEFVTRAPRMTIDEVQRVPDLLHAIKRVVDLQRPRTPGQFLLTGSANLALMRHISESLAGRAVYLTIWPMTRRELLGFGSTGTWSRFLTAPNGQWYDMVQHDEGPVEAWPDVARRGGYPVAAYEYQTDEARRGWFRGYIQTYLRRDIPDLSEIHHGRGFQQLMRALALRIGNLQNQSDLGRDVGLPQPTVHRYLDLLETSFQLIRLPGFTLNRTTRLIKVPKVYWSDTGLAMALSLEHEGRGAHLENIVLCDLLAWRDTVPDPPEILYWRTTSKQEVDFVIETAEGKLLPIEVKATTRPTTKTMDSMRQFLDDYQDRVLGGLVLHGGNDVFWISKHVLAAPWWRVL